ncbi:SAM-dependent methyltransferase [Amycolatopsis bartoniae]|uniref:Methyltransferase domain-containing protein n=1 Tax=Amycolatopsis bartoniae TaxID=941986 RepID=A0A8H9IVB9_9PSEU|nr:class I SAM-dependent methyltransferase [Amycolatopsis bartoniae]MBB2939014.1 SAM-dependent methyltransferase [Amycolatopsis bartoniae]TVT04269.1 class I SAM-dependent methyltransferase [Amycolatopsis bartoniae]GHF65588.1 hypothetical protein GCM10017566_43930 [Amycolatopsis bartoniae]
MSDHQSYEEIYRSRPTVWSGKPNPQLVAEVTGLPPGTALDAGCGEGGDALWLASHGWRVTGVDFVPAALERATAHAKDADLDIEFLHADVTTWTPERRFDLVSAHYLHMSREPQAAAYRNLAQAVAPGGTLLIVGHDARHIAVHRPDALDLYFTLDETIALLGDGWQVEVAETRPRVTKDGEGREVHVGDSVLRARRTG